MLPKKGCRQDVILQRAKPTLHHKKEKIAPCLRWVVEVIMDRFRWQVSRAIDLSLTSDAKKPVVAQEVVARRTDGRGAGGPGPGAATDAPRTTGIDGASAPKTTSPTPLPYLPNSIQLGPRRTRWRNLSRKSRDWGHPAQRHPESRQVHVHVDRRNGLPERPERAQTHLGRSSGEGQAIVARDPGVDPKTEWPNPR